MSIDDLALKLALGFKFLASKSLLDVEEWERYSIIYRIKGDYKFVEKEINGKIHYFIRYGNKDLIEFDGEEVLFARLDNYDIHHLFAYLNDLRMSYDIQSEIKAGKQKTLDDYVRGGINV